MRRVKIGWKTKYLLPYFPYNERGMQSDNYKGEDGIETYRLLEQVFYKKNGRYYMETREEEK